MKRPVLTVLGALGALLYTAGAWAAVAPADKCEAGMEKAAGKYASCLFKAESKYSQTGDADRRSAGLLKCDEKLINAFAKAELKSPGACPVYEGVAARTLPSEPGGDTSAVDPVADALDNARETVSDYLSGDGDTLCNNNVWEHKGTGGNRKSTDMASVDGKIYIPGGLITNCATPATVASIYDPATETWSASTTAIPRGRYNSGVAALEGKVYTVGGRDNSTDSCHNGGAMEWYTDVDVYDPDTDSWTSVAPLAAARSGAASAAADGKIYIFGGSDGYVPSAVNSAGEAYDPQANTWSPIATLPHAMGGSVAAELDGLIYVNGGDETVQVYDPAGDQWLSPLPAMQRPRTGFRLASMGGKLYAISAALGEAALEGEAVPQRFTEEYDPDTNSWTLLTGFLPEEEATYGYTLAVLGVGGRLYANIGFFGLYAYVPGDCTQGLCQAATCGNGVIDDGESCDVGDLDGEDCVSQGFAAGTLSCGPGCTFDTSGCIESRWTDNGDGTVSDNTTGLMWEKKGDPGSGGLHDIANLYKWTADTTDPTGSAFATFLAGINNSVTGVGDCGSTDRDNEDIGGYAGHCDWRVPTILELRTLGCCGAGIPGAKSSGNYWSSSSASDTTKAWTSTSGTAVSKTSSLKVRAVRGRMD